MEDSGTVFLSGRSALKKCHAGAALVIAFSMVMGGGRVLSGMTLCARMQRNFHDNFIKIKNGLPLNLAWLHPLKGFMRGELERATWELNTCNCSSSPQIMSEMLLPLRPLARTDAKLHIGHDPGARVLTVEPRR